MSLIERPLRYAHSEGHTNVCFSDNGEYIVTCGSEGDVRIWKGFDDEEPVDKCVGDKAYAVIVKGDKMYVGTSNNYVQSFTFPEPELDGVVTRFKAPVTSIDASSSGNVVVCGSQDMEIHVTENGTLSSVVTEHKAPILSISVDPKGEYFASSSCDGTVKVWKLSSVNEAVATWDCVPKSNSVETSPTLCKIAWSPTTGYLLAVPQKHHVALYERNSWDKTISLPASFTDEKQMISVCSFSPCDQFLAASTTDKRLLIWNIRKGNVEASLETKDAQVCAIAWQPTKTDKYELVFCNNEGYLGYLEFSPNSKEYSSTKESGSDQNYTSALNNGDDDIDDMNENNYGIKLDDDDDDNEFAISVEKIKADLGFNADGTFVENPDQDDRARSVSRSSIRSRSRSRSLSPRKVVPEIVMQPAFQPSSTPTCLQYRFMAWNDVGVIEQTNTEDDQAISVRFHDASFHYPFRIANELNYSMASLSLDAVVFAGEKTDEKPSYLGCHPLKTGLEWFSELPEDEEAVAVAAGSGWVAVATSMLMLRIFTTAGNQREVVSLAGPIVCLGGYKNLLAVVFHSSTGVGGYQWLNYSLLEIVSTDICKFLISSQSLPLTPNSTLKWMGFSDCGALCTSDSTGFVRLLSSSQGWHPICNTKKYLKGKSDHYFVLGVNECLQMIKVILCKGSDYPPVIPVPYMTELPWKLPLCGSFEEKGGLEEVYWRTKLANKCLDSPHLEEDSDALSEAKKKNAIELNRSIMKLFSIACLENHISRAFELCRLSNSTLLMERAMQYAHLQNKTILAEQISELLSEKKSKEENETEDLSLNMYSSINDNKNIHETVMSYVSSRLNSTLIQSNGFNSGVPENNYERCSGNYSQDMFAQMEEPAKDSSISSIVQKKKLSPYAGRLPTSKDEINHIRRRALNPFKKSQGTPETNKTSLTPTNNKTNMSTGSLNKKQSKLNRENMNISTEDICSPKSDMLPFKEWFNNEKENFQKENPTMSIAQITKIALKKYKELKISNLSSNTATADLSNLSETTVFNETVKENFNEDLNDSDIVENDVSRKRKYEEDVDVEEKSLKQKNKKNDEVELVSGSKSKKLNISTEEITFKKGVVKSASKLTGFFHKK